MTTPPDSLRLTAEDELLIRTYAVKEHSYSDGSFMRMLLSEIDRLRSELATLKTRNQQLEAALKVYADERNWGWNGRTPRRQVIFLNANGENGPSLAQSVIHTEEK